MADLDTICGGWNGVLSRQFHLYEDKTKRFYDSDEDKEEPVCREGSERGHSQEKHNPVRGDSEECGQDKDDDGGQGQG